MLSSEAWLRRLARSLIADEGRVNELVQYVYTEAMKHKPMHLKSWASVVMRRAAMHIRVSEWRRKKRENAVAREERLDPGTPDPDRSDTRERLAALVHELEEPYRQTMILHFFEDLSYEETAARLQVPVATVRTRVQRALSQMRQKLRAHYGEPSKWVFALGPVAGWRLDAISTAQGATLAKSRRGTVKLASYGAIGVAAVLLLGISTALLLGVTGPGNDAGSTGALSSPVSGSQSALAAELDPLQRESLPGDDAGKAEGPAVEVSLENPSVGGLYESSKLLGEIAGPGEEIHSIGGNMKGSVFMNTQTGDSVNMKNVHGFGEPGEPRDAKSFLKAAKQAAKHKK